MVSLFFFFLEISIMTKLLSFSQTLKFIAAVGDKRTVIVEGENGIGKTALFHALKRLPKFADHIAVDPIDCTQLSDGSVWMPDLDREAGVSRELPNERFGVSKINQRGVNGSSPVLIGLDELAKAPNYIKNVLAPIVYDRRIGNYHMPEGSVVVCFTNLSIEGLGDSIQAHLRNRLVFVKMRKPTADEWKVWALDNGVHPIITAFVEMNPKVLESFLDYEPDGQYYKGKGTDLSKENGFIFNPRANQQAYATPRSLVAASDVLYGADADSLDDDTLEVGMCGTVGDVTAQALSSFIRFGRQITPMPRVVSDPTTAPLSDNPTAQLVQVFKFVADTKTREEAEAVTTYVLRMVPEMQSLFTNSVATSRAIGLYASVTAFTGMMREHRDFQ
jgi:hypothetical protein